MDQNRIRNDEVELQHFEFSSTQFIDEFKQMATNFIKDILDGIKSMYLSKESDEKKKILNDELDKVYLKFTKEVHYVLLQYEPDIREFFAIPEHVASKLDFMSKYPVPDTTVEELQKELTVLEHNYLKEKSFHRLCEKELSHLLALEPHYNSTEDILKQQNFNLERSENQKLTESLDLYNELVQSCFNNNADFVEHYNKFIN